MKTLSILSTKLSAWGLHLIGRGGSMPGSIGCKVDKNILTKLKFNGPVILVTGTNGKTSTANMITDLFQNAGYNVISNRKGDNSGVWHPFSQLILNIALKQALFFYFFCQIICFCISYYLVFCDIIVLGDIYACYNY